MRRRESTFISCFLILNAFQVEDFLRVDAGSHFGVGQSSAIPREALVVVDVCVGNSSISVASSAGDAALDEVLLPSKGGFVGVLWGLAEISVN